MLERDLYIKKFALRAAERIFRAPLNSGEKPSRELFTILLNPKTAKGDRLEAGLLLIGSVIPNFERYCANLLSSTNNLPIDGSIHFLDYGGEQNVFLAEIDGKKKVLKIDRQSLGLQGQDIIDRAIQKRREYQRIQSWFSKVPLFIQDEDYLIVHSHLLSIPAVATVQPLIEGVMKDFFEDYETKKLLTLLRENTFIRNQFMLFADVLLRRCRDYEECIDILGPKNLSIVEKDGQPSRLMLIDPHVIYTPALLAERPPDTAERLKQRVEYIEYIFNRVF